MTTAWENIDTSDILTKSMIEGALGITPGWLRLENTNHYQNLKKMIDKITFNSLGDIGCGAGEVGRVIKCNEYCGYDLPHVIEKVSKVVNPQSNYCEYNANNYDYTLFTRHDLLICNGFLSEIALPLGVLDKILKNTSKFLIIHRQPIIESSSNIIFYKTYGNLDTHEWRLSKSEFYNIIETNGCKVVCEYINDVNMNSMSFLVEKINNSLK